MHMRIVLFFLFISQLVAAQEYAVQNIPKYLLENADAVLRTDEWKIEIKNKGKAIVNHSYAITILNANGEKFATYANGYDKLRKLTYTSGRIYDAQGTALKSLKIKDLEDRSSREGFSIATDDRVKVHRFSYPQYPYTVAYQDEVELNGILFLKVWNPQDEEKLSVQKSTLTVDCPLDYALRYKQINYSKEPTITKGASTVYSWAVQNLAAIKYEHLQPSMREVTPCVLVTPTQFEIEGYSGSMESWKNLGQFFYQLNKGRDELPISVKNTVHTLTDGVSDKNEKIKILYNYLQKNTRYISIQLGIGGWQTFSAQYVAEKGYGDCKALSNYMVSLLKEAGIIGNYVLVRAGEDNTTFFEDFPNPYFNHAIVCVPNGADTTWLECTSQSESAGFMGSATGNRKALMISDEGSSVIQTPVYKGEDNIAIRKIDGTVDSLGNLKATINTTYKGISNEDFHQLIHQATPSQREEYVNDMLSLATYSVDTFEYVEQKSKLPVVQETLQISSSEFATITGRRMFLSPNLGSKSKTRLDDTKERKFPIVYHHPFSQIDTITLQIPKGYVLEAGIKNEETKTKFGSYSITYEIIGNAIHVYRKFNQLAGTFPPSDYAALCTFLDGAFKADRGKMVFVMKKD